MDVKSIQDELREFGNTLGDKAHVSFSIANDRDYGCCVAVYPTGIVRSEEVFFCHEDTFEDAMAAARTKWAEMSDEFRSRKVRDMALAIIRITDDIGGCSDAALRAEKFTESDIQTYGEEACNKADQMAGNGPFKISKIGLSNNAA